MMSRHWLQRRAGRNVLGTSGLAALWLVLFALWLPPSRGEPAVAADGAVAETTYRWEHDLPYRVDTSGASLREERCLLDVYVPEQQPGFATVVWFHGGGLTSGAKEVPEGLQRQGIGVVAANYRLSPQVNAPVYIEDAAAAVAWTIKNIEHYGGSPKRVYVAGHSAGGYLALMVTLDKRWLQPHGIDPDTLAGVVPYSGQTITHFTIRKERGIADTRPIVDELAPVYHVRKDAPPVLVISGDRQQELLGRYEESAYFWRMMQVVGHPACTLVELPGYDHGAMAAPAHPLLLKFIQQTAAPAN